jgi:multidrug efflux system membrane fusion protein
MDALTPEPLTRETPPSARKRSWFGRLIATTLSLAVLGGIVYTIWFWPAAKEAESPMRRFANVPIPVLVAPATRRDTPVWLDGLGTAQASQSVTIRTMVEGPLLAVNFQEGQAVRQGDVLAQVDPRPYRAALDAATARKAQNEAMLANARLDLARYQKLVASNFTSAQQADTARAEVARFQALVEQDQATIDTARTQLDYATIRAPIDGRAGIRLVDAGNIVRPGDANALVVIARLQPISIVFTLPQQVLPRVAAAMAKGELPVIALPQGAVLGAGGTDQVLDRGVLTVLDNQVDATTGTIKLKATFPNAEHRLWPGGFVGVRLRVDILRDAVVIPTAAVQRGPRGAFVYLAQSGGTAERRSISVGYEDDRGSVVTEGLQGGERVVVDGVSRLNDGSKINPAGLDADPAGEGAQRRRRGG